MNESVPAIWCPQFDTFHLREMGPEFLKKLVQGFNNEKVARVGRHIYGLPAVPGTLVGISAA